MMMYKLWIVFIFLIAQVSGFAASMVGVATVEITPPTGTPSAGYEKRKGAGMVGVHDPLLASAVVIDDVVFCSVDHLGMPYSLIQQVKTRVKQLAPSLDKASFFIGSSHTHAGGGAFFDLPIVGEMIAGPYDEKIALGYVEGIVKAIVDAAANRQPGLVGIGYGVLEGLTEYRATWPEKCTLENDLAILKITKLDGTPLAVLFNFAMHPTVLKADNMLFSADFVGYSRAAISSALGKNITCLYFNGAQAEVVPIESSCDAIGSTLGNAVVELWHDTKVEDAFTIEVKTHEYAFVPKTTPFGLTVPLESYKSEVSCFVINKDHLFVAVPGELSSLYNTQLKKAARKLGYEHLAIFGLVNDAHGYILMPEAWQAKTQESGLSFGGEFYGQELTGKILTLFPL